MKANVKLLTKIGIPVPLFWGYIGLVFFIFGACIENSWFSAYLNTLGWTTAQSSSLFTAYGVTVTFCSWFSGMFCESYGVKKVMLMGTITYLLSSFLMIYIAIPMENNVLMTISYMLRGGGYPLFAYAFLVLITESADTKAMGKATSWFWVCFNLGFTVIGPTMSSQLRNVISYLSILKIGILSVIIGTILALTVKNINVKKTMGRHTIGEEVKKSLDLLLSNRKLLLGLIVKTINNIGQFSFVIIMPAFFLENSFTMAEWSLVWGVTYIINIFASLLFGFLSDHFGWREIVMYFSGTLTALSCVLIYVSIEYFSGQLGVVLGAFTVYAFGIAAFGPLSALMPALLPDSKGSAISILNLGSGLSNFVGPLLVSLLLGPLGIRGLLLVFAVLYLIASILTYFLRVPTAE